MNLTVDNIKPKCEGGDKPGISNLKLLCICCHKDKTKTETVIRRYAILVN